jgi:hypothetical protein
MPGILSKLLQNITETKAQKQSAKSKLMDFEKMIADQARSQGMMPRTYLEQLCQQSESFANSKLVKVLLGERDVPTQKGRDAKPEVLTKRAMNVVKKGIKHSANKQRRRMDKDSVEEDVKDQFTKLINPMGQDSRSLEKIKQSPGFHQLIITMFASGTQADMDWDEIFSAMSKMLNMNPIEIKAILQQDGMDFSEPDAAERFKQNMGATGFLGKGKSKTLNSMYEDEHQDRGYAQMIIQQHPEEYKKFMQTGDLFDAPTIYEKLFAYFSSSDADEQMPYGTQKARDGDPYVWLTDKLDELGLTEGNEFAQKVRQLKAQGAKKGTKFKTSDGEEHTLEQILTQTRQLMDMLERKIQEQSAVEEDKTDKEIDDFHRELDQLVHKHFGHSSDEKREKVKESVAITEEEFDEAAGKKDACYHKVKARYKVWPSAYASGALVQCRKKGAANWGNKSD